MPDLPPAHADLRASLHGVRAFLLDADGVIVLRNRHIDGAAEALAALAGMTRALGLGMGGSARQRHVRSPALAVRHSCGVRCEV